MKKKINTKSTFLSNFWLAVGLEYLFLSRDSWVRSLQGQIGFEHLGFLVQTSKVKLSPAALVITSSLSGSGRALTWLLNGDYLDTHNHNSNKPQINTPFTLLNMMQCFYESQSPRLWHAVNSRTLWLRLAALRCECQLKNGVAVKEAAFSRKLKLRY